MSPSALSVGSAPFSGSRLSGGALLAGSRLSGGALLAGSRLSGGALLAGSRLSGGALLAGSALPNPVPAVYLIRVDGPFPFTLAALDVHLANVADE
jgi:hypothetical protein